MAVNRTINISRIRSTLMFCSCPVTIESSEMPRMSVEL
jgi:hypothetical protein